MVLFARTYDEALAIAKQIISIDPKFNQAHEFISKINTHQKRGHYQLPDDLKTLEDMAINFVNTKQFQKAEKALLKFLPLILNMLQLVDTYPIFIQKVENLTKPFINLIGYQCNTRMMIAFYLI